MSDFKDTVRYAMERGILLDSCGEAERQYWWGLYNDLCGMSVEDALKVQYYHQEGGIDPSKKTNIVNFTMQKGTDGEFSLYLVATYAPTSPVIVSFTFDGSSESVTIPAGTATFNTGIKSSVDATKPYAEISNISLLSEDELYNYAGKNSVKNGFFTVTIDNDGDVTVDSVKYGSTVQLPTAPEKEGYTFAWTDSTGEEISGSTFIMPESDYTVNGRYTVKTYEISFTVNEEYLDEGEINEREYSAGTLTLDYGVKVLPYLVAHSAEREGYSVSSWKTSAGTTIGADFTMPAENISAEALYSLNEYTITYVSDGSTHDERTYYFGQEIEPVSEPSKIGYEFDGWTPSVPTTMPASNLIITAKFNAIEYRIYYTIDDEPIYTEVHSYGDAISIRAKEIREGYSFEWTPSSLPSTMPAEDINVTGEFKPIDYTFKCLVDGNVFVEETYHFGDSIETVNEPSKTGYEFVGWLPEIPATMPSSNLTCEAQFSAIDYTISYEIDGEIVSEYTETRHYGDEIEIRDDEVREGYTFSGWNPSSLPLTMPDEDILVSGTFSINEYTLEYVVDGEPYSAETYEYGAAVTAIAEPEKEGYTFSGWDNVPQTMPAADTTVNGAFSKNSYTISYIVDGEPYSAETYEYGAAVTPIAEPSKVGYTFGGWSEIPATMPAENVTVQGSFTVNVHTIDYIVDGSAYSSETYDYGQTIVPISAPAKEGYTFVEWSGITATMPDYDLTVTAVYEINSHTAEYRIKSGDTYEHFSSITYNYGETIVDPSAPEKAGYTFAWEPHAATMPDSDIIIIGEYTPIAVVSEIFDAVIYDDAISAITAQDIKAFSDSYDGENDKRHECAVTVPASQQCIEWAQLRDEADEMYIETGDEQYAELVDYYQGLIDTYANEHLMTFAFAIPTSLSFNSLTDENDNPLVVRTHGTYTIDDNEYILRSYISTTNPEMWYQNEDTKQLKLIIKLN